MHPATPRRLSPLRPGDHAQVLRWLLLDPAGMAAFRREDADGTLHRTAAWTCATLAWLPAALVMLALAAGLIPAGRGAIPRPLYLAGLAGLWAVSGLFGRYDFDDADPTPPPPSVLAAGFGALIFGGAGFLIVIVGLSRAASTAGGPLLIGGLILAAGTASGAAARLENGITAGLALLVLGIASGFVVLAGGLAAAALTGAVLRSAPVQGPGRSLRWLAAATWVTGHLALVAALASAPG